MNKKQIQGVVNAYDLGKLISYKPAAKGLVNDNNIVKTSNDQYVVRKFFQNRNIPEVKSELELLDYLVKKKFPYQIPVPIRLPNGSRIFNNECLVYKFIPGVNKRSFSESQIKDLAKMIATYHKLMTGFKPSYKKDWGNAFTTAWQKKEMSDHCPNATNRTFRGKLLLENKDMFHNLLNQIDKKYQNIKLPKYTIHNDLNRGNILFENGKISGLIDFDNCHIDYIIKDITQFLYRGIGKSDVIDFKNSKLFLDEYRKYKSIPRKEIAYIPDIAINSEIGAFMWMYDQFERNPKTKIKTKHIIESERQVKWFDKNRDKIIRMLS